MIEYEISPATGNRSLIGMFSTERGEPRARQQRPWRSVGETNDASTSDSVGELNDAGSSASVGLANFADQKRIGAILTTLLRLSNDYFDDFRQPMSQVSIQAALAFFQRHSEANVPALSAEPSGYVIATWRRGREVLTMRFKEGAMIQFALARELPGEPCLKRTWGATTVESLAEARFTGATLLFA